MATKKDDTPAEVIITPELEQAAARAKQAEDDAAAAEELERLSKLRNKTGKKERLDAEKQAEKDRKDREDRTVVVRALRRGFYPADGKIRNPGDVFDYVLHRQTDGNLEEKLPSWVEDVDGEYESRVEGQPVTPVDDKPITIEVTGRGAAATATRVHK